MKKQHRRAIPGAVQLDGDVPNFKVGQLSWHVLRSLSKHTLCKPAAKRAVCRMPVLIVAVTRVLADIGGRRRFAKPAPILLGRHLPNEVGFRGNRASSSPQIRFRSGSTAGICPIVGLKTQIHGSLVRATREETPYDKRHAFP